MSVQIVRIGLKPSAAAATKGWRRLQSTNAPQTANAQPANAAAKPLPSLPRRKTLDFTIIGASIFAILGVAYYQYQRISRKALVNGMQIESTTPTKTTFTIPLPASSNQRPSNKTLDMLSPAQAEARLREHEESYSLNRPGNCVTRFDIATLASNSPIEDDHCTQILARDSSSSVQGDMLLFGVFDGHAGWQTSRLISEKLVQYVARELNNVFNGTEEYQSLRLDSVSEKSIQDEPAAKLGFLARLIKAGGIKRDKGGQLRFADLDADADIVSAAIKTAFKRLDYEITTAPVAELRKLKPDKPISEDSMQTLLPALSGSCALLSYIDTARNRIHVACTGDSRAVMGTWEEDASRPDGGKWRVDVLTEDQTGRNLKEVARMQAEHPQEEKDRVIMRGRVLGGLEPTRAFGDCVYKWDQGTYQNLIQSFRLSSARRYPQGCATPPYVTVDPEITVRELQPTAAPPEADEVSPPKAQRRFMVLATDGLYDRLENDTIVGLVGAWLEGERQSLSEKKLLQRVIPDEKSAAAQGHVPSNKRQGQFIFSDANVATHLIRNALGGADEQSMRALLSIPAPLSRRYRDDMTVTVVMLGGNDDSQHPEGVRRIELPRPLSNA